MLADIKDQTFVGFNLYFLNYALVTDMFIKYFDDFITSYVLENIHPLHGFRFSRRWRGRC